MWVSRQAIFLTWPTEPAFTGDCRCEREHSAALVQGYGLLDKAIFVFNTSFWDTGSDFLLREMPDWSGRWSVFLNYQKLFPSVKALVAIHVADTALALEGMSDDEVVDEGMAGGGGGMGHGRQDGRRGGTALSGGMSRELLFTRLSTLHHHGKHQF